MQKQKTHFLSFEMKSIIHFTKFTKSQSSESKSLSLSSIVRQKKVRASHPNLQPPISPFASQFLSNYLHNTVRKDLKKQIHVPTSKSEKCHKSQIDKFVVLLENRTTVQKNIRLRLVGAENHNMIPHTWSPKASSHPIKRLE